MEKNENQLEKKLKRFSLLAVTLMVQLFSFSAIAEEYYLSSNEKIMIALGLKLKELPPEERSEALEIINSKIALANKNKKNISIEKYKDFLVQFTEKDYFEENNLKSLSIEDLIEKITFTEYSSPSESVQKKINKYILERGKFLEKSLLAGLIYLSQSDFLKNSVIADQTALKNFNSEVKKELTNHINSYLDQMGVNASPQAEVLSLLLKSYFLYLPEKQKMEIVFQISQLPFSATADDVFMVFIQNCGPQLQKLIQIIGRSPEIPEQYRKLFQRLESEVKSVPWKVVQNLLLQDGIDINDFTYFERKPLGVGTMAQTHRAQFVQNGVRRSMVLRFLKPDMARLLEVDRMILQNVALQIDSDPSLKKYKLPSLSKLIDDLNKSVLEELNVEKTALAQQYGKEVYNKKQIISFNGQKNYLNFYVPSTHLVGRSKSTMLQELVFGKKPTKVLTEYKDIYPDLYKKVSEAMAIHWVQQAFFESGFFHADLHQGNILMHVADAQIHLNILDFGMTGQLTKNLRESAILLSVGIRLNHAGLITKHFKNLSKTKTLPENFLEKCKQRIRSNAADSDFSISGWTAWALDNGLEINYEFLKLNRGMKAIEILLQDSKSSLTFEKIAFSILKHKKAYVSQLVLGEKLLKSTDIADLIKIGFNNLFQKEQAPAESALNKPLMCIGLFN